MKNKGSQFANVEYRTVQNKDSMAVLARDVDTDRLVGHLGLSPAKRVGEGQSVGLVYTDPDVRKQGIGGAMYNIAHRELGYAPLHDTVRSPAGDKFAKSVGGPFQPNDPGKPIMKNWELDDAGYEFQQIQRPNWDRGVPVDQTWAKALTPVKPKKTRKRKSDGVQEMLPGMEGF